MVIEVLETDQVDDSTSTLENICRNEKLVSEQGVFTMKSVIKIIISLI
jgi:hypothetical protein